MQKARKQAKLNFNISTYHFSDLDLESVVKSLESRDREIIILYLMGHKQKDIAEVFNLDRSMISKRLKTIMEILTKRMVAQDN